MREIKFRAWHKEGKKMLCDVAVSTSLEAVFDLGDWEDDLDEYIPMQYTGFKDKNGKEIYEGDILYIDEWGYGEVVNKDSFWIIEFKDNEDWITEFGHWQQDKKMIVDGEVVGNIYENPELLEELNNEPLS